MAAEDDEEQYEEDANAYQKHRPPHCRDPLERGSDHSVQDEVGETCKSSFAVNGLAVIQKVAVASEVAARFSESNVLPCAPWEKSGIGTVHGERERGCADAI